MIKNDIAIVGSGITGLLLALSLSQYGHKITLFDRKSHVGGRLGFESDLPFCGLDLNIFARQDFEFLEKFIHQKLEDSERDHYYTQMSHPSQESIFIYESKMFSPFKEWLNRYLDNQHSRSILAETLFGSHMLPFPLEIENFLEGPRNGSSFHFFLFLQEILKMRGVEFKHDTEVYYKEFIKNQHTLMCINSSSGRSEHCFSHVIFTHYHNGEKPNLPYTYFNSSQMKMLSQHSLQSLVVFQWPKDVLSQKWPYHTDSTRILFVQGRFQCYVDHHYFRIIYHTPFPSQSKNIKNNFVKTKKYVQPFLESGSDIWDSSKIIVKPMGYCHSPYLTKKIELTLSVPNLYLCGEFIAYEKSPLRNICHSIQGITKLIMELV